MSEDKKNERLSHKTVPSDIQKDDVMAIIYYVKVTDTKKNGEELIVQDLLHGTGSLKVTGKELIEASLSADRFQEEVKVSMTKMADIFCESFNRPFSVCFTKKDGNDRVLKGRYIAEVPRMGYSWVEDLEKVGVEKNPVRQVNHHTIKWLVVDGVKYTVK